MKKQNEETIKKLKRIAMFAYNHTKYYHRLYQHTELQAITSSEQLPIVEAKELASDPYSFCSDLHIVKIAGSSGTMGNPKLMFRTARDIEKSTKNQMKLMSKCGLEQNDVVGILQPSGIWGYSALTANACEKMGLTYVELGNVPDVICVSLILNNQVTIIDIAPSRLKCLMDCWEEYKKQEDAVFPVKKVMCAGEKLSEERKNEFQNRYGFRIFNQYGSEEFDALGWEAKGENYFKLLHHDFLFEILDSNNNPVPDGSTGHLVVTSFYHHGTPLIRYNLNDLVIRKGNGFEVLGRNGECIHLYDSVKLTSSQVYQVIQKTIARIGRVDYQLQIRKGRKDGDIVKLVLDCPDLEDEEKRRLLENLKHCTIDTYELCKNEILEFEVSEKEAI